MKFLKPLLLIATVLILTLSVNAANRSIANSSVSARHSAKTTLSFNANVQDTNTPAALPLNNDVLFAFIAIASLSTYLAFKRN